MDSRTLREVLQLLQSPILRVRTGIWMMPNEYLGHEADEAVRLNIDAIDLRQVWLDTLPKGTHFIGLTPEKLIGILDHVIEQSGNKDCLLVYNIDLFLAHLKQVERNLVWESLFNALPHRTRGLLIVLPQTAQDLLPATPQLIQWEKEERLAGIAYTS